MNMRYWTNRDRGCKALAPHPVRAITILVLMLSDAGLGAAVAQSKPEAASDTAALGYTKVKVEAPAGHAFLKDTRGGAFLVAKSLKNDYDRLLSRVQALQADLDTGRVSGADALRELQGLQTELDRLRKEIDKKKVFVSSTKVHLQSETATFDLGPAKLLVITADRIRVEGWDGPQVKCVLEKSVLAPEGQPVDEHLRGMKLVHHHGRFPEFVGRSSAEEGASEREFLASADGQELSEDQRERRKQLIRQIAGRYEIFRSFQGKDVDSLEVEGLTHEQGNRSVVAEIDSPGGEKSSSSVWQRDASLTVYLPRCEAVALRGCLESLDVRGVQAALVVTADGSRDRDYDGHFQIQDLQGSLTVKDAPLDLVAAIHGNVSIRSTVEFANTGSRHDESGVTLYTLAPRVLTCRNIDGDVTASFTRAALKLEAIKGRIDVRNEFGDTTLAAGRGLAQKAHRVISESGGIEVLLLPQALGKLPLLALTSCGTVYAKGGGEDLLHDTSLTIGEELNFMIGQDPKGRGRSWRGLTLGPQKSEFVLQLDRVSAALEGRERPPGLDVISRCGMVRILCEQQKQSGPAK